MCNLMNSHTHTHTARFDDAIADSTVFGITPLNTRSLFDDERTRFDTSPRGKQDDTSILMPLLDPTPVATTSNLM